MKLDNYEAIYVSDQFYEGLTGRYAEKKLLVFRDGIDVCEYLSGITLEKRIKCMSGRLQEALQQQEKVVILLPQGLDYIYSVLGCMDANVIAVPTSISMTQAEIEIEEKLLPLLSDSGAACIVTNSFFCRLLEADKRFETLAVLNVDHIEEESKRAVTRRACRRDDLALILYTSGSTSQPKGVMLTHENILLQAMAGAKQWGMSEESCIISWMPQFHNFGLFFNFIAPLMQGAQSVILPPDSFIKCPELWFQLMDSYKCTHTAAPNFAFDYCCTSLDIELLKDVSLQHLKAIISGGEPVRKETYENFIDKFHMSGLRKQAFCPHYGMSEAGSITTLNPGDDMRFISLDTASLEEGRIVYAKEDKNCKYVTSCGAIPPYIEIICVDIRTGKACSDKEIGEVWIKSPAVGSGYYKKYEETEKAFHAVLLEEGSKRYFRTGDLGFIEKGHLYIIGREKEVIIIRGKNYHPADIEWTIQKNLPNLTLPISIFSCESEGEERVIVVQEIENTAGSEELKRIVRKIRACISDTHTLDVSNIVLVNEGNIPRTGSGKIQRKKCKEFFLNHKLDVIYQYKQGDGNAQKKRTDKARPIGIDVGKILITDVLSVILNVRSEEIEEDAAFGELGFDSIKYVQASKKIEEVFQIQFAPVMMFKYRTIKSLAQYLTTQPGVSESRKTRENDIQEPAVGTAPSFGDDDIAIIGISCNFPGGSDSPKAFWKYIEEGKDCITRVTESRNQVVEDYRMSYGGDESSFPEWGGFIEDVDKFDAAFFGISPLEAESMDPQQRKVLELTWSVLEDGGYDPASVSDSAIGLFMGVHNNDYAELVAKQPELMDIYGPYLDSGLHMSMITHRASRWFNFHGPSEVINTACSSSLVAIHHAVQAINRKECCMAIAGGINLILSSRIYTASQRAGMLSEDGRCKTFDESADGFVRSEGYGAILLKPLKDAFKDNDSIYGVIKSTAVNHDGQSNSLRAPNLNAQKKLLLSAYSNAGISVENVSYIEAHGTGTALGDPIEFQAMREAFEEMGAKNTEKICGLGTVKTNIGHSESAAGIAGLIKVLLSLKHKKLPGILHYNKLNPYIALEASPFYVVDKKQEWRRIKNENGHDIKRCAGISSFGYGGANAHIVVEEYDVAEKEVVKRIGREKVLIPLAAKKKEVLVRLAKQLLEYLNETPELDGDILDLSYTLQTGRSHMDERVIFLVRDITELKEQLEEFKSAKKESRDFWCGNIKNKSETSRLPGNEEDTRELLRKWMVRKELEKIAEYYVQGGDINWHMLYETNPQRRLHLPTYPFEKNKYWIPENHKSNRIDTPDISYEIHPLLMKNTSNFMEQRFCTKFTGRESFLEDHTVFGQSMLPGAVQIEMVRAAFENAMDMQDDKHENIRIKNVVWANPIVVNSEPVLITTGLFPTEEDVSFTIYEETHEKEKKVYSLGTISHDETREESYNLEEIKEICKKGELLSEEIYERFKGFGIEYGVSHRGIKKIFCGDHIALAKLSVSSEDPAAFKQFVLHPGIIDAALQATITLEEYADGKTYLPYAAEMVEIQGHCSDNMWARIERLDNKSEDQKLNKYNIDILDNDGVVRVKFHGLSKVAVEKESGAEDVIVKNETCIYVPVWKQEDHLNGAMDMTYDTHIVMLIEPDEYVIGNISKNRDVIILQSDEVNVEKKYQIYAVQLLRQLQRVIRDKAVGKILIQVLGLEQGEKGVYMALAGMMKTARLENIKIIGQLISIDSWTCMSDELLEVNAGYPEDVCIRYKGETRFKEVWNKVNDNGIKKEKLWKRESVYLITGGMGGIGRKIVQEIADQNMDITLILTGRSPCDAQKQKELDQINSAGIKAEYRMTDVSNRQQVSDLIKDIMKKYGKLNGIIHGAGVRQDNFILKKTEKELKEVFLPKVNGTVYLDQESRNIPLDFFIYFSSVASSLGNAGQSDYAAANGFMDQYAVYRDKLADIHRRFGRTLCINWALWKDGGMKVDNAAQNMMYREMGMLPMYTQNGIEALYHCFDMGGRQYMVIGGNASKLESSIAERFKKYELKQEEKGNEKSVLYGKDFEEQAVKYFTELLSTVLHLPAQEIVPVDQMEKYGIDSIMIMQLTERLEQIFGTVSKTLFFEYQSIQALTGYFLEAYSEKLYEILGGQSIAEKTPGMNRIIQVDNSMKQKNLCDYRQNRFKKDSFRHSGAEAGEEIAVIGLAGKYPGAETVDEFWEILKNGKDCITEIPGERWSHDKYYDSNKSAKGKTYSKWGGFIEGVDQFDPLFFNISPTEAQKIDPQERLFLQTVHSVIEDAGYSRESLRTISHGKKEGHIGVFVGVMYEEYQLYAAQEQEKGINTAVSGSIASIANRISYFYNLHGPSMAVDTMCSSSLAALHLACQSMQNGECEAAIAGGVNVSIHPNKYLLLAQGKFVSSKGKCESFGEGGDGYVPGEGVGAVLLKPLSKAIRDGDHIYGVIKGTAINHGGKTNGYTVPNPKAQTDVIEEAMNRAGVHPDTISYIEAHGTGTALGDPIEITGLMRAFGKKRNERQPCAIGSVKSNIGHCESAAGIAGLTKVLLQMKYKHLVPSLHSDTINSNIDFTQTPFVIQQGYSEWGRIKLYEHGMEKEYPRRAGLSAFGAGGSNAHVIIEEYIPRTEKRRGNLDGNAVVILLSARNEDRLRMQVQNLLNYISKGYLKEEDLADMAYTLQTGRSELEERLGIVSDSMEQLEKNLRSYLNGQKMTNPVYKGRVAERKSLETMLGADEDIQEAINIWIEKRKYEKLLELWVNGFEINWERLHERNDIQKISLPTYPFEKGKYWLALTESSISTVAGSDAGSFVHPLLHRNTSDLNEQRFCTTLTGNEFFLAHHVVRGDKILPGAAYLEMIRAGICTSVPGADNKDIVINNVVWLRPFTVYSGGKDLHISILPEGESEVSYEIYSGNVGDEVLHCQGKAMLKQTDQSEGTGIINIDQLKNLCSQEVIDGETCYEIFREAGIEYGNGHRGIECLYISKHFVLAKLSLPEFLRDGAGEYVLHPSMLDSAIQATIAMTLGQEEGVGSGSLSLPFALGELRIKHGCKDHMWAYIRESEQSSDSDHILEVDIDLMDEQGKSSVYMKKLLFRSMGGEKQEDFEKTEMGTLMLKPVWRKVEDSGLEADTPYTQHYIMLCEPGGHIYAKNIEKILPDAVCEVLDSAETEIYLRYEEYAVRLLERIRNAFKNKTRGKTLLQLVVFPQHAQFVFRGLSGLLKTANIENPDFVYQIIEIQEEKTAENIVNKLQSIQYGVKESEIKYENNVAYCRVLEEVLFLEDADMHTYPWKEGGVYLITGGMGGLGLLLCEEIVQKVREATVILTGRSQLNDLKRTQLYEMNRKGCSVVYISANITSRKETGDLVSNIVETYGGLNGIVHSAGVIRDNYIINKCEEEFLEVLKPKVRGVIHLDECTRACNLDFIILFSSMAGETGNTGQADYAAANAFMDAYTCYRNELVKNGICTGKTISVNWPLWEEGGMHIDEKIEKMMFQNKGIIPLKTKTGLKVLYKALSRGEEQVMPVEGELKKLREVYVKKKDGMKLSPEKELSVPNDDQISLSGENLREKAENYFKKLLSTVTGMSVKEIEPEVPMERYGIDSVMILQMTEELEKSFGSLSKTLFFEYSTIRSITRYFMDMYKDNFIEMLGIGHKSVTVVKREKSNSSADICQATVKKTRRVRFMGSSYEKEEREEQKDIAIIGLAGHYPQAENISELWKNLCEGRDCISEIPEERWDYQLYYDPDRKEEGKSYSKWGGFLRDVDKFDPLYFHISSHEAERMDPQERLFLECTIETLEDAGYTTEALSRYRKGELEGSVGVFVGSMYNEYQLYGAQKQAEGEMVAVNGIMSSLANRVSYFCNFHGPSISLNTMCSSSLSAIHLACQSIRQGECRLALAGGVNLTIHPNKYLLLCQSNFLSGKGRCESFGETGDGYVPGEGVGAVLLKPLAEAVKDNDQIYGVIKGSAINHGGRANGYTVPNPNAQADIIREVISEAGVRAEHISYIEAHGTGTALGDPIEIAALSRVFEEYTEEKQFCAIGSVKSNIGHSESAAGIAGLTKILLQMKYGKLVPSLHSESLNRNIEFENTPFKVQQGVEEWKRPVIDTVGGKKEQLRIAGLSSFGAGGSNAHLVIQEYEQKREQFDTDTPDRPALIILSAKEEGQLRIYAERLLDFIESGEIGERNLYNIAYTLQTGRTALEVRMGILAVSIEHLKETLAAYISGREDVDELHLGNAMAEKNMSGIFNDDSDLQEAVSAWMIKKKYAKLLSIWVKGIDISWEKLYDGEKLQKLSLPTYPFMRESYWIPDMKKKADIPMDRVEYVKKGDMKSKTVQYLTTLLSEVSSVPENKIKEDVMLEAYGIDSIMIKTLSGKLGDVFGRIDAAIFFEYQDLQSLAGYFMEKYRDALQGLFHIEEDKRETDRPESCPKRESISENAEDFDIAIIGLSGRYPEAENVEALWENLKAGKDCIREIPKERWDYSLYYDADEIRPGKIQSKWGGFIDDVDKFDPLFFNILPEDAKYMDPQERLFLECAYETLEDAGYTRETLVNHKNLGSGEDVGVFVGVTFSEYQLYGIESQMNGKPLSISGITSSIANRVSYFCNFHGPSLSIDSMCSSSLTALSIACDNIKLGKCKLALAGGVNVSLHPNKYMFLSQYNFLSSKGRCESFGDGGDGYVPGEGVGAILLKPLRQAQADGDHIYGIIKSATINHGGKTNGYSVPNLKAQANVIRRALAEAKVHPEHISYIEAHGTGTSLGDPVEIAGLSKVFNEYTDMREYCAIGSVKSNIGHLEAAAGIAGITKVLLQMKYKQLVPSIHSKILNTNIDFASTPFHVQRKLESWNTKSVSAEDSEVKLPRVAAISSFGAGGSNAHVIIQEYVPEIQEHKSAIPQEPVIIVLSACDRSRLRKQVQRLLYTLSKRVMDEGDLRNVAYTLQVGREAMEERFGVIVFSFKELKEKLHAFLEQKPVIEEIYATERIDYEGIGEECTRLLELWMDGQAVDWEKIYINNRPMRISLPTYPFAKEHCWYTEIESEEDDTAGMVFLKPVWRMASHTQTKRVAEYEDREIILCEPVEEIGIDELNARFEGAGCSIFCNEASDLDVRYEQYAKRLFVMLKKRLQNKPGASILFQLVIFEKNEREIFRGLGALLKTAQLENPKILYQVIHMPESAGMEDLVEKVEESSRYLQDKEIRYEKGSRIIRQLEEMKISETGGEEEIPWKEGGVYLITGGAGGLGLLFAKEIVTKVNDVSVILTGRSELSEEIQIFIQKWKREGVIIQYIQADITVRDQAEALIHEIMNTYDKLNGILHSAGVVDDNFIISKTEVEFEKVQKPKVRGTLFIDYYSRMCKLDFIVLFSSGVSEFGNSGQADYAVANAFMDSYAAYRNALTQKGERYGKMLTINWPLWDCGGMHIAKEIQEIMFESKGMFPMKSEMGIHALYEVFGHMENQTIVIAGNKDQIRKTISATEFPKEEIESAALILSDGAAEEGLLKDIVTEQLVSLFSKNMKLDRKFVDPNKTFESYGVDSVKLTVLNQKISVYFKELSSTIFFEYRTLASLGEYLYEEYPEECEKWAGKRNTHKNNSMAAVDSEKVKKTEQEPIAVIGISGRFPDSDNVEEFWKILKSGQDCIREVPENRWNMDDFYEEDAQLAVNQKKSCSKWGGFVESFAEFDPLFFNISPAQAERMDPQERIFLEACWKAMEDAGYILPQMEESQRRKVGVFGAITKTGYQAWNHSSNSFYNTSFAGMVNRLSYFMDVNGPSIPVDTMCSSALTALHQACESIRRGEIKMAIVGAVNLYLHPNNYTSLTQAGLLSDSSQSTVFGEGGTGFIPSEGVGAVILKPLSDAQREKDGIWAVIKGSAVLHSGKTNGYSVPDPGKQAAVIEMALQNAEIAPETIRHVEAAASGSEMADAIEMSALTRVFGKRENTADGYYTMSSVKAIFGHGEAVSGMVQFIKAVMQLRNNQLCPIKLPERTNPNIKFGKLPFHIVTRLTEWEDMKINGKIVPKRIGVNSFGAGGVYAHLIVEAYEKPIEEDTSAPITDEAYMLVLSAKTTKALHAYVIKWRDYLEVHPETSLRKISYILQTKREVMKQRFASIAKNTKELIVNLEDFLHQKTNLNNYIKSGYEAVGSERYDSGTGSNLNEAAKMWIEHGRLEWKEPDNKELPSHILNLPTYPFGNREFWVKNQEEDFVSAESILEESPVVQLSKCEEEANIRIGEIEKRLQEVLYDILYIDESDEVEKDSSFMELGIDSISVTKLIQGINRKFELDIRERDIFDYPDITQLANYITSIMKKRG